MKSILPLSVLAAVTAVLLVACDNPQKTANTLRSEIATFQVSPTDAQQKSIEENFSKLETQIAALEKSGQEDKAAALKSQLSDLRGDYQSAKMSKVINDTRTAIQGVGEAVKDGAKSIGDIFKSPSTNGESSEGN
jgi:hypothetical protein